MALVSSRNILLLLFLIHRLGDAQTEVSPTSFPLPSLSEIRSVYNLERMNINFSPQTVGSQNILDRLSLIQKMVVSLRNQFSNTLLAWGKNVTRDIQLLKPEYYSCAVQQFNKMIRRDFARYPSDVLEEVRITKEAVFESFVEETPIADVSVSVYKKLDYFINRMNTELNWHSRKIRTKLRYLLKHEVFEMQTVCKTPTNNRFDRTGVHMEYLDFNSPDLDDNVVESEPDYYFTDELDETSETTTDTVQKSNVPGHVITTHRPTFPRETLTVSSDGTDYFEYFKEDANRTSTSESHKCRNSSTTGEHSDSAISNPTSYTGL